jgi:hypothetical protein
MQKINGDQKGAMDIANAYLLGKHSLCQKFHLQTIKDDQKISEEQAEG